MLTTILRRMSTGKTIFDRVLSGEIPSKKIYEDKEFYAFSDINPGAKVHILLIPKNKDGLTSISKAQSRHQEILGKMMLTAVNVAKQQKELKDGYRLVINDGKNGLQTVDHLHIHIIGGQKLLWPPG